MKHFCSIVHYIVTKTVHSLVLSKTQGARGGIGGGASGFDLPLFVTCGTCTEEKETNLLFLSDSEALSTILGGKRGGGPQLDCTGIRVN